MPRKGSILNQLTTGLMDIFVKINQVDFVSENDYCIGVLLPASNSIQCQEKASVVLAVTSLHLDKQVYLLMHTMNIIRMNDLIVVM